MSVVGSGNALRSGYTTGTCAAACAGAAVLALLTGEFPPVSEAVLPSGSRVRLQIEQTRLEDGAACCAVRKDAGDDPDVTNGTLIFACARRWEAAPGCEGADYRCEREFSGHGGADCRCEKGVSGHGGAALSEPPSYGDAAYPGILITGGPGIGVVTRRGLACPPGYYAINPVPRRMIMAAAEAARQAAGQKKARLLIEISAPEGVRLAARTFNPHLGIEGGISILGTSGIVNPMSEQALLETIRLDIRVRAAEGRTLLAVAPGNYGEQFLQGEGLSAADFVKCSNFVGDTFRMLQEEGIRQALLAGHPGKLIKVAGGVLNTHSRYGDRRMEILAACGREAGLGNAQAAALLSMNTTEEAAQYLLENGMAGAVFGRAACRVREVLEQASGVHTEVMLFSSVHGLLARTEGAAGFIRALRAGAAAQASPAEKRARAPRAERTVQEPRAEKRAQAPRAERTAQASPAEKRAQEPQNGEAAPHANQEEDAGS